MDVFRFTCVANPDDSPVVVVVVEEEQPRHGGN